MLLSPTSELLEPSPSSHDRELRYESTLILTPDDEHAEVGGEKTPLVVSNLDGSSKDQEDQDEPAHDHDASEG